MLYDDDLAYDAELPYDGEVNPFARTLALFLRCDPPQSIAWAPLYLHNTHRTIQKGCPLLTVGEGLVPGALPFSGSLPLYLHRPLSEVCPLYLHGPGEPVSGVFPLFTRGSLSLSGAIPLVIPLTRGTTQAGIPLWTNGW